MPQKTWAVGEEVLAADFNQYVQNQTVPAFTSTTQRDSQWTAPPTGARCVAAGALYQYSGTAWFTPFGLLGRATHTSHTTGIGTGGWDMPGTLSITHPARRLRIVGSTNLTSATSSGAYMIAKQGSTTVTGRLAQMDALTGGGAILQGETFFAHPGGTVVYKLSLVAFGAAGTITVEGSVDPMWLEVWDAGI